MQHEDIIQTLLMLARKTIMMKWVGDKPPSIPIWKLLLLEVLTSIRLGYFTSVFLQKWMKLLEVLGLNSGLNWYGHCSCARKLFCILFLLCCYVLLSISPVWWCSVKSKIKRLKKGTALVKVTKKFLKRYFLSLNKETCLSINSFVALFLVSNKGKN